MDQVIQFLIRHGYLVLFFWVLVEQIGLPLPAAPILVTVGALSGSGDMNFFSVMAVGTTAALLSDLSWFLVGRNFGSPVLSRLCRISLEPDSCVRRTEDIFSRHGARSLLTAKFIPGLNVVAMPLAGVIHMSPWRFLFFDSLGVVLWMGFYTGLGYIFSRQLDRLASYLTPLGNALLVLAAGALAAYIIGKYIRRVRFLKELQISRITPEELKRKLDGGEDVVILDVRHSLDFAADPQIIPGALHLPLESLRNNHLVPRNHEVVLYCTCPNEASSARVALILRKRGITRVRPLAGGLNAWRKQGFPAEILDR